MSKIYDALMDASKARHESSSVLVPAGSEGQLISSQSFHMEEEMLALFHALESLLPQSQSKVIQFIGSRKGEGTSTIAREFAKMSAFRIGLSVLLLDADRFDPCLHAYFPFEANVGSWFDAVQDAKRMDRAVSQVGTSKLYVSPSCNSSSYTPEIFHSESIRSFWDALRSRFDLTVIDSAPLMISPDALAMAPNVDGVVLVVEAEKTRWTVAESVKERITKAGGKMLGVVFNKRRYYIPQPVYNLL